MKFLRSYLYFLISVSFALPLVYVLIFTSPYVFSQIYFLRIIVALGSVPLGILWVYEPRTRPKKNLIFYAFSLFIVVMCISGFLGADPYHSYFGSWDRFGSIIDWLFCYVYYLMLITTFRTMRSPIPAIRISVLIGTASALFGIAQLFPQTNLFSPGVRIVGTIGNPGFFASYEMLIIALSAYALAIDRKKIFRYIYSCSIVLGICAIYLSGTRSALLAAIFFLICLCALYYRFINRISRKAIAYVKQSRISSMILLVVALASIVVCLVIFSQRRLISYIKPIPLTGLFGYDALSNPVVSRRSIVSHIALRGFFERPLLGWGENNFSVVFQRFYDPKLYVGMDNSVWFDKSHNEFIDRIVLGGILGLLSYCWIYVSVLIITLYKKRKNDFKRILSLGLIMYAVYLLFFFHSIADTATMIIILSLLSYIEHVEMPTSRTGPKYIIWYSVMLSFFSAAILICKPIVSNYFIHKAKNLDSQHALMLYDQIWPISRQGDRVILQQLEDRIAQGIPESHRKKFYQYAVVRSFELARIYPFDIQILMKGMLWSRVLGEYDPRYYELAMRLSDSALALSSSYPPLYHVRSLIAHDLYLSSNSDDKAREWQAIAEQSSARAIALTPNLPESVLIHFSIQTPNDVVRKEFARYVHDSLHDFSISDINLAAKIARNLEDRELLEFLSQISSESNRPIQYDYIRTLINSF